MNSAFLTMAASTVLFYLTPALATTQTATQKCLKIAVNITKSELTAIEKVEGGELVHESRIVPLRHGFPMPPGTFRPARLSERYVYSGSGLHPAIDYAIFYSGSHAIYSSPHYQSRIENKHFARGAVVVEPTFGKKLYRIADKCKIENVEVVIHH